MAERTDLVLTASDGQKYNVTVGADGVLSTTPTSNPTSTFSSEALEAILKEKVFYDEITTEKKRDTVSGTDYYVTTIPKYDKDGNIIRVKHGFPMDTYDYEDTINGSGETARAFSKRVGASFVANCSISTIDAYADRDDPEQVVPDWNSFHLRGVQIKDGVIYKESDPNLDNFILGIKADNTFKLFPPKTSASTIIADGCVDAITGFYPLVENGVGRTANPNWAQNIFASHPRNIVAQDSNNTYFIICSGRTTHNKGWTWDDAVRVLQAQGKTYKLAYLLDGGGSGQQVVRGQLVNPPVDDWGRTERRVGDFLYVSRESSTYTQNLKTMAGDLGELSVRMHYANRDIYDNIINFGNFGKLATPTTNCNTINVNGNYYAGSTALNTPSSEHGWIIEHSQISATAGMQFAIPDHSTKGKLMSRRTISSMSSWYPWREV